MDARAFVKFSLRDEFFDVMRFRSDLLDFYKKNERKRFTAIQEVRRRHAE
jgi:hypothetical protein